MVGERPSWILLGGILLALGASGCQTDAYCFVCERDNGGGEAGRTGGNEEDVIIIPHQEDTGAGGAPVTPDAGCDFDTQTHPDNCGTCGHACVYPGAFGKCVAGECQFDGCADGLVDLNGDDSDGCECTLSNDGVEICDGLDNDCNGVDDDGFDVQEDVSNCGACHRECPVFENATVACALGDCQYTCADGFSSLGQEGVGCPYQCPVFPTVTETCNGVDDDCDGIIDNDNPGADQPCDDNCPNGQCVGACISGSTLCTGTTAGLACVGGTRPTGEICDHIDNDCDGETDEGFDFENDPLNCNDCGVQCNAVDSCIAGQCDFHCEDDERDLDGNPANRCEYQCPIFPLEVEVCDGIDQDCDGIADNGATDVGSACTGDCPTADPCVGTGDCAPYAIAPNTGTCYGVCSSGGVTACPSGVPVCRYADQRVDELCNGDDDNCDGRIDEGFNLQQDPANCGVCGRVCVRPHTLAMTCTAGVCNAITACEPGFEDIDGNLANGCEYTCPVFPPTGEVCNGIDDDCDGVKDDSPSGSGQSCTADCPAPAACIAARNCTDQVASNINGCYGACAADGRTACNASGTIDCTHPGQDTETCNGLDDDCDGLIDDGFSFLTDRANCGSCGFDCLQLPNASTARCVAGVCESTACRAGFKDIDNNPQNGCEYACPVFPTRAETCNGIDDDCDGVKDDTPTDVGQACAGGPCPAPAACVAGGNCAPYVISPRTGTCYGDCRTGGITTCSALGALVCSYTTVVSAETCDGNDENCDGRIDEGFDKQTDPNNCGTCGNPCTGTHVAARTCAGGICGVITSCVPGFRDIDGNPANGCEYTCPVFPPVGETCNNRDDDCNGVRDDNVVGLGQSCTNNCPAPNACVATGNCTVAVSTNTNGCYGVCATDGRTTCPSGAIVCNHPAQTTEACNGVDDNCDGRIDEGFNKQTDVNNCGTCGVVCSLPGAATVRCAAGACEVVTCTAGRADVDGNEANGCEYACPQMPTRSETCNGIDDDCDGVKDDAPTDVGTACSSNCPGGVCQGVCTTGTFTCVSGSRVCQGGGGVQLEICNNLDDDCNGTVDNGFNKQTDPLNCNSCGNVCNLTNVDVHACVTGNCRIFGNTPTTQLSGCDPGFGNRDNNHPNGCEYTCPVFPTRTETCNGVDDNCDGLVDAADPDMATPANFCDPDGPCAGSVPQCTNLSGTTTWHCNYGANVDVTATGTVALVETRCDGIDNNCQGQVDEAFPLKGTGCTVGRGVCSASSTYACTVDKTGVQCPVTATPTNAVDEDCNGLDDNCDGNVDERTPTGTLTCYNGGQHTCLGWVDPMVRVGAAGTEWIYAYEASRPDANDTNAGVKTDRACSKGNRLPWASLNEGEAAAACAAALNQAGNPMHLCSAANWETACEASVNNNNTPLWSYSTAPGTYVADQCNDRDTLSPMAPWATGTGADCYANWGGLNRVYDMSGNLSEWTSTTATVTVNNVPLTYYRVRGGNYQTFPLGTRCDFNFVLQKPDFQNFDLGFRCCSTGAP